MFMDSRRARVERGFRWPESCRNPRRSSTDGEEFVDILASADSALSERWVSAIEALVMSTVAAGPIFPAG